jgi:hypothetical protein
LALVVARSLELWRTGREFFRALGQTTDELDVSLERLSTFESRGLDRLSTSTARLEASRARLGVLTGALGRVREQWAGLLGLYPKK